MYTTIQVLMLCFYWTLIIMAFGVVASLLKRGVRDVNCYARNIITLTETWLYITISLLGTTYGMHYCPIVFMTMFIFIFAFILAKNLRQHLFEF